MRVVQKSFFVFIMFCFILFGCSQKVKIGEKDLDFCLKDYNKNGCFLGVRIIVDSTNYNCIVRNFELYRYFLQKGDISENAYEDTARSIVRNGKVIHLTRKEFTDFVFRAVGDSIVNKLRNENRQEIIDKYFQWSNNGVYVLKQSVPAEYWEGIVYVLFEYGVVAASYIRFDFFAFRGVP